MRLLTRSTDNAKHGDSKQAHPADAPRGRARLWLRTAGALVSTGAAVFLIGACSGGGGATGASPFSHTSIPASSRTSSSHKPAHAGTHPSSTLSGNSGAQSESNPTAPITFTAYNYGDAITYTLTVDEIVRQGPFVRMNLSFGCRTQDGCSGNEFRGGGNNYSDDSETLDGIDLVDPTGKTLYQPVYDADGHPLSSVLPDTLQPGATQQAWVTFPAPPPSVRKVTVQIPAAGVELLDVPVPAGSANWYPQARGGDFDQAVTSTDTTNLRLPVFDLTGRSLAGIVGQTTSGSQTTVTLSADVLFDFNSAQLTPAASQALASVAKNIDKSGQGTVTVTGYTDNIGDAQYNQQLSQQRAQAVVAALQAQATDASVNYQAAGMGDADPVAPNQNPDGSDNPSGRAQNRRVTVSYNVGSSSSSSTTPTTAPQAPASPSKTATYTLSLPYDEGQETYQVTANGTQTDGNFTILNATVTCQRSDDSSGCHTSSDFTDGNSSNSTPDGVSLIDHTNGTSYYPVEAGGSPVTDDLPDVLPVGSSATAWVWFSAPAADNLSVQLPDGPVIQP